MTSDAPDPQAAVESTQLQDTMRKFPQTIGHRGYNSKFPENTMCSFMAAIKVGSHALEADVHISRDEVVVLSHDPSLKRCFGIDKKIIDCDWSYLSTLKTLKEPHVGMPRLLDLLSYLATPSMENIWLLLDIKVSNNADDIMRLIARTINDTPPSSRPWRERILLGCWAAEYFPFCDKYLLDFGKTYIGFDIIYARRFLSIPGISFNLLQLTLVGWVGSRFLRDAHAANRAVFVWTVNKQCAMCWSIEKEVDGVITDDPAKFLKLCDEYDSLKNEEGFTIWEYLRASWINTLAPVFGLLFRWRYGFGL